MIALLKAVELRRHNKQKHDFAMLNALAGTPAAKAAIQLASEKLSNALNG